MSRSSVLAALGLAVAVAQQPGPDDMPQEMVWVDRAGRIQGVVGEMQQSIFFPEFSPDDRFIAVSARDGEINDRDIWIHDVAGGSKRRVTASKGNDNFPVWSPDGRQILFTSSRSGGYDLYLKNLDSGAPETRVLQTDTPEYPHDWSPDGRLVTFTRALEKERAIFSMPMSGSERTPSPFQQAARGWSDGGKFSPNGRYLAFASNMNGPWEVYVALVENPARVWKVSRELSPGWAGGGGQPRWRGDGKELFYIMGNDTMLSVEVNTEGEFTYGPAKKLFALPAMKGNFPEEAPWLQKYDVTRDGQRFVFVRTVKKR